MQLPVRTIPMVLSFALISCGGSAPPRDTADHMAGGDVKPPESSSSNAALEDEHKSFMTECTETPAMKDYCTCAWDNVTKTTSAEDRKDLENPKTKKALAALADQCGSKMPKEVIKSNFVKTCAKSPEMTPFCECSFNFLDGKGLLTSGADGIAKVEGEMKTACSKELYDVAKAAFLHGCSDKQPEKVCTCTFAALEKKYGKDKLQPFFESGTDEVKKAVSAASKTCGAK